MVKIRTIVSGVILLMGLSVFGAPLMRMSVQPRMAGEVMPQLKPAAAEPEGEVRQMQFYADNQYNIKGTDTVVMVRNVVLHHNGAVVTCDSAVRYSEHRFECFGNVIINQDSTYIYCKQALYDREVNTAQVIDRLIKVVNGTSTLYTYNFSFNTLDSIGRYWGGGTMLQDSNRMESQRGWYHSHTNDIYAAGKVQMADPDYKLISDSVRYNTGTEVAEFYTLTYIWNPDNEMLSALSGIYDRKTKVADLKHDSYVMTEGQELWADSLVYNLDTRDAVGRSNIQLRDEEQQTMAFGDYGEWYGAREEGMLTRDPSLVSWDKDAPEDTVYMRSDSMYLFSVPWDSLSVAGPEDADAGFEDEWADEGDMPGRPNRGFGARNRPRAATGAVAGDSVSVTDSITAIDVISDSMRMAPGDSITVIGTDAIPDSVATMLRDSITMIGESVIPDPVGVADSLAVTGERGVPPDLLRQMGAMGDTLPERADTGSPRVRGELSDTVNTSPELFDPEAVRTRHLSTVGDTLPVIVKELKIAIPDPVADSVVVDDLSDEMEIRRQMEEMSHWDLRSGHDSLSTLIDTELPTVDSAMMGRMLPADSVGVYRDSLTAGADFPLDSMGMERLAGDSLSIAADSMEIVGDTIPEPQHDSLQRIFKAYNNVRIWRRDFQAVCDSMVALSKDSTAHMYINPVLWNEQNQITCSVVDIYTRNKELERVEYTGDPLMAAEVEGMKYNQIKGLKMESFFRDNDVFAHRVDGNVQTIYYKVEEGDAEPNTFVMIHSATLVFLIDSQQVSQISYSGQSDFKGYPMDQIPPDQEQELEGFKWEAERRPGREDVFTRTIRPSRRESYLSIRPPTFPLTQQIERHKQSMIEQRIWEDRYELLPQAALNWLRSQNLRPDLYEE